jgi:hypothetical protein
MAKVLLQPKAAAEVGAEEQALMNECRSPFEAVAVLIRDP